MKKVFCIAILMIFCIFFLIPKSQASDFNNVVLNVQELNDEVVVTLSIDDIGELGEGVNAYIMTLNFNAEQFEFVKVEGKNNWNSPVYNSKLIGTGQIKFVATRSEFMKQKGEVIKITLKGKNKYSLDNIKMIDISFAAKIDKKTTKIQIKEAKRNIDSANKIEEVKKDTKVGNNEQKKLTVYPKAGKCLIQVIIINIIIIIVFGLYYYKYKKIDKYIKGG